MGLRSLLLRARTATLLLVLCLQLEVNKAQEDTTKRQPIILNFTLPKRAAAGDEVTVTIGLGTELRECMVVKAYLKSDVEIDGAFNYKQTRCLCNDSPVTFYWDFYVNRTAQITAVVDIVRELNICPYDMAVIPIESNRFYWTKTIYVS